MESTETAPQGRSFKKLFVDFSQWCTLVCLNKVATRGKLLAIVYTIVFVIMLFLFVFISVNLVLKYLKYPSSTELTLDVQVEKFPRFSFCNENPMKRSVVDSDPSFTSIAKMMKQIDEIELETRDTDDFGIQSNMSMQRLTRGKTMLRLMMQQLSDADRIRGGYSFTELVSECSFSGKTCTSSHFTSFLHPDFGVCYTFVSEREITRAGAQQGLRMLLTVNQDSPRFNLFDFLPTTDSASIRAVIHQPDEFPDFEANGFKIGASRQASISLSSIGHTRADKPYGNCTSEGEHTDNYYTENYHESFTFSDRYPFENFTYTYNTCKKSCLQRVAFTQCGCVDPLYRKAESHGYCSTPTDMICLVDLLARVSLPDALNGSAHICRDCPPQCNETRLSRTVTYGVYPSAKYKVAAGTQLQRGLLLDDQGGGREGQAFEDVDDYDHPQATTPPTTPAPICVPEMLRWDENNQWTDVNATTCRAQFPQYYYNASKFTIIQGWPCLSNKTCQTCVMFTEKMPPWEWPCRYFTYEQCVEYNQNVTTYTHCDDFFLNFDFIPTGANIPNITGWQEGRGPSSSRCRNDTEYPKNSTKRAACWREDVCKRIPSSSNISKLAESPLLDPAFLRDYLNPKTTRCQLSKRVVSEAREHLASRQTGTYGRKKRSAAASGQSGNSVFEDSTVDVPGYGSCEFANKNFKGPADCIKWYKRNGLTFELYFGSLEARTYTQAPTYLLISMLSDVGGHAGLWLGISVVSLVELFALIFMIFNTLICGRKGGDGKDSNQKEGEGPRTRKLSSTSNGFDKPN